MSDEVYKPEALKLADKWRELFNPLERLVLRTIVNWLYLQQMGACADITWFYEFMERRNPTLMACVQRRTAAMEKLDWTVRAVEKEKLPPGATVAMAEKQRAGLDAAYRSVTNLRRAIEWRSLAAFRGYAHLEKHYDAKGNVIKLEPVPQWNWARAGRTGAWYYNKRALSIFANPDALSSDLTEIEREDFVIGECSYPVDEAIAGGFFREAMAQKDWDAYLASFGIPSVFVELPPNAPVDQGNGSGDELDSAYQKQAEGVVNNARGVMPNGAKVTALDVSGRGRNPFLEHFKFQDEKIVLAATGGKLTMLTESGSGTLAGKAHKDSFDEIAEADAIRISEDFNRDFDAVFLAENFPGQPILARFVLEGKEVTDPSAVVDDVTKLANAGYAVPPEQIEEKTGYRVTLRDPVSKTAERADQGDSSVKKPSSMENRSWWRRLMPWRFRNRDEDPALERFFETIGQGIDKGNREAWLPMAKRVMTLLDGPDDQFEADAQELIDDLPELLKPTGADDAAIDAWKQSLTPILFNGLTMAGKGGE